ncbi:pentapeptide repeat-containing protein [uncultured Campylobacter sp.]|uniref:pentapeptide repeat-containing protein n=1 Tax=uncultured Campylobacter sp. TaxID=218934 RepID=UPI003211B9CD
MGLDIDKILQAPKEEIEQNDLKRLKELGIISENIYLFDTLERPKKQYWIKKCEYDGQSFFIFNYFFFSSDPGLKNHINLEKYLQSDEPNIILQNCLIGNQKDIKNLSKIKQAIIVTGSEFPNISFCEFENEVFSRNINNSSAFSGCKFAKEVYVDGYAFFQACTFNGDFVSKNAREDIDFIDCIFNKSFELTTRNKLQDINFEGTYFNQKFTMDIREFDSLNFSYTIFNCEFKLQSEQINGKEVNFTNTKFKQKVSFYRKTIDCRIFFDEACFENNLILIRARFNNEVILDKAIIKGEAQFRGTKFSEAILTETTFKNKADFSNVVFNNKADFTNVVFEADTDFNSATFDDEARFLNADFKGTAIFENIKFKKEADFKTDSNLTFGKDAKFKNTIFLDNACFNNRVFEDFADFHEANFKKVACFYSVTFKKPVNFSSIIFNGALNFVNAKTDFTYEELKELIETQIKHDKSIDNIKRTNDFRDGFRLMKHALNNKGNALDASLFHRLELYCKELELEFTLENAKDKNSENSKEVKSIDEGEAKPKSKSRIELFLDLIMLKLYRNTSDHHTNLLRIINFMALTVAIYGFSIFMYEKIISKYLISLPYNFVYSILLVTLGVIFWVTYHRIAKYNIAWINMLLVGLVILIIILVVAISAKYTAYIALFITLYLFLYYKAITKLKYDLACLFYYGCFIAIFFIKPFLIAPFISIFTSEQAIESKFKEYTIRYNENGLDDMLLDANLTNTKKDNKLDFIVENRKTILDELDNDKALLIDFVEKSIRCAESFMNHNMSNKNMQKKEAPQKPYAEALAALKYDEIMQSTRKTVNLLYGFIMLLVVYSLTKTARRNSVVPS